MSYGDSTNLASLTQSLIVSAELALKAGPALSNFCTLEIVPQGKSGIDFPTFTGISAGSYAETSDYSGFQNIVSSAVTVTPTDYVSGTLLYDTAKANSPAVLGAQIGSLIGDALLRAENDLIWGLFTGASNTGTGGGATTDITEAMILSMLSILKQNAAPPPYYLACTSHVVMDLLGIYATNANLTATAIRDSAMLDGRLAQLFGCTPLEITNLSTSIGDAASATIALFSKSAIGVARRAEGIVVETQRDASARATEIIGTLKTDAHIINDNWIVKVQVDNNDAV